MDPADLDALASLQAFVLNLAQRVAALEERQRPEPLAPEIVSGFEMLHRGFVDRIREEEAG